jgi:acyl carrier protein
MKSEAMKSEAAKDRVYRVVSDVFGVPLESVNDDSSADTIETWDSLTHINLVLSLENEFGVALSPEDAMEMLSVKLIRMILEERGAGERP